MAQWAAQGPLVRLDLWARLVAQVQMEESDPWEIWACRVLWGPPDPWEKLAHRAPQAQQVQLAQWGIPAPRDPLERMGCLVQQETLEVLDQPEM
jgi:hypothetical protein